MGACFSSQARRSRNTAVIVLAGALSVMFPVASPAATCGVDDSVRETREIRVSGPPREFAFISKNLLISPDCLGRSDCDACKALAKATTFGIRANSASRGAVICTTKVSGEFVRGYDAKMNEYGLCSFPDGSLVGTESLYAWALKNDIAR